MPLLPHQEQAIEKISQYNRYGIFLDVGTGKTCISIHLLLQKCTEQDHILIVTTKSLVNNWKEEIKMWGASHLHIKVLSKEQFKKLHTSISSCQAFVIDEAHNFAGMKSGFYKSALKFLKRTNPKHVYLATATPIMASVWSVWTLSTLTGSPIMSYGAFKSRFFYNVNMGGRMIPIQKKNIENQIADILRQFGFVMSKDDAKLNLPGGIHEPIYFKLNDDQVDKILSLDNDPTTVSPVIYLNKKIQIASGTLKENDGTISHIPADKLEYVLDLVETERNCVIVARHTAEIEMLHKKIQEKGIQTYVYNGQTSVEDRDKAIKEVNNGNGILLLQADMGIGFNLTGVSLMVFYSHTYDYIKYYQCLGRIDRIGQTKVCRYLHLITKDSPDNDVYECLKRKESFDEALYLRKKKEIEESLDRGDEQYHESVDNDLSFM